MKTSQTIAIAVLAAFLSACSPPAGPDVTVNVNNVVQVTTTINFANPVQSEKTGCAAIASIEINRPSVLAVGDRGDVLITPKDSSGQKRTPDCDIADGVTISANPTDVLSIEDPHAFVTKVTGGPKKGTGKLLVNVGKASGAVDVKVE